jgi:hypothetical protein
MTDRDKLATDALARHFAYLDGTWWEHLNDRQQATYRAKALDVIGVVGPIYQAPPALYEPAHTLAVLALQSGDDELRAAGRKVLNPFPRPMSKE